MKYILILAGVFISMAASAQSDTTACILRVDNTKRCTSKIIRGYEVTTRSSEYEDLIHVAFLRENKKRIRTRKNRRVCFVESLM
jgi:hypothetical protein